MLYEVPEYKWDMCFKKASSKMSAVLNRIYDAYPSLVIDAMKETKWPHVYIDTYCQSRSVDGAMVWRVAVIFEQQLGMDCRMYRIPGIMEEPRIALQKTIPPLDRVKKRMKTSVDYYHFLCYVRDLVENDIRLFNAMRMYATL